MKGNSLPGQKFRGIRGTNPGTINEGRAFDRDAQVESARQRQRNDVDAALADLANLDPELQQLVEEQRKDDTHIVRPDRVMRYGYSLDAAWENGDGGETSFANVIGVDMDGEIVSFIKHNKGSILTGSAEWHGTEDGYSNHLCRCTRCRAANAAANRRRKRNRIENGIPEHVQHGTEHCYGNYGCRCPECKDAHRENQRAYYNRTLGAIEPVACGNSSCGKTFTPHKRGVKYCGRSCQLSANSRARRARLRAAA